MSQVVDLCEDSDDNGEPPNTAPFPSLSLSGKRRRDKEESENGRVSKNAKDSAKFVVDLELANDAEISPHRKQRVVVISISSVKNDAAGNCAIMLKGVKATEREAGSVDAQVTDHSESNESIPAAAATHPINSDSEQSSRDDDSTEKHTQRLSTSKPPTKASGRQGRYSAWEDRLSELAEYHKIHGHCNVPHSYSDNLKLGQWVAHQRSYYKLHLEGKASPMAAFRIKELDSLGFEWDSRSAAWEDYLSELAAYRKIHGHCKVPKSYRDNLKLGKWVAHQRCNYRLHLEGKPSAMTTFRIKELDSLGFEWDSYGAAWEDRLSELADYRKIHGHCNVPQNYNENSKLAQWVKTQRKRYRLHLQGKISQMTLPRIQALESLGFEWGIQGAAWEDRLSELADYRKIHGHCNVPQSYNENPQLAQWVKTQRKRYRLHREEKRSPMPVFRIQELESLGFEWKPSIGRGKGTSKKASLDDDARHIAPTNSKQGARSQLVAAPSNEIIRTTGYH
jgi:hypothetical protein